MKKFAAIAAIVAVIALALYAIVFWPPQVKLKAISADAVPSTLQRVPLTGYTDIVWRAVKAEGDPQWAAFTAQRDGRPYYCFLSISHGESSGQGGDFRTEAPFNFGMGCSRVGVGNDYFLSAEGYALDARVTRVIGKTRFGDTAEANVIDGFWMLVGPARKGLDNWTAIEGLSSSGKVLYHVEPGPKMPK
jgi:hypothetical protein